MTKSMAPSIFEDFNARNLSAAEVARSFVPSTNFSKLLSKSSSILVGPRGSGKTTMLKMCQQEALDAWEHTDAIHYRQKIDFEGVYIPTDVSWAKQIQLLGSDLLSPEESTAFTLAAFSTNVLRNLADTMDYRSSHPPRDRSLSKVLSEDSEAKLVHEISDAWMLPHRVSTFLSLKHQLSRRLQDIYVLANQETLRTNEGRAERIAGIKYLSLPFLTAAQTGVEMFNDAIGDRHRRWALMFDELELAPQRVIASLKDSLRSTYDRFIYKLSLAPYCDSINHIVDALSATPGNDYSVLPLSYAYKEEGKEFSLELWDSLLREANIEQHAPEDVFGKSLLTREPVEWLNSELKTAYRRGTPQVERMRSLSKKDKSFCDFLDSNSIDLDEIGDLDKDKRARTVRKAVGVVALRNELLGSDGRLRSRKTIELYCGAESLFTMVEGNPRWFKGIIGTLLLQKVEELQIKSLKNIVIKKSAQAQQLQKTVNRFFALLNTIPLQAGSTKSLPGLLNTIGQYFHHEQVLADFTPEPPGRFTVDKSASDGLISSLGQALNAGAIVSMESTGIESGRHAIVSQQFRLSYLLAAHYKILLRTGRAVSLNGILKKQTQPDLPRLFDLEDDDA